MCPELLPALPASCADVSGKRHTDKPYRVSLCISIGGKPVLTKTSPKLFGAICDDLTGGVELASMLVAKNIPTSVSIGHDADLGATCLAHVTCLKTRITTVEKAVHSVSIAADKLIDAGYRQIFFKYSATFDSTDKGNIGPCVEVLRAKTGADRVVFCPTFPERDITVYKGLLFFRDKLVSDSQKKNDPLTPMANPNLVEVLAKQSHTGVGLLPHAVIDQGAKAIAQFVEKADPTDQAFLIADALYERDLAAIAKACVDAPLLTGHSAITPHLADIWRVNGYATDEDQSQLPAVEGAGAVLVGSVSQQSSVQLERFAEKNPVFRFDVGKDIEGEDVVPRIVEFAREHLPDRPVAICTTFDKDEIRRVQAKFGQLATAERVEAILAKLAVILVSELGVKRLIVAGGETSGAIVNALGIETLNVGPYSDQGVPRTVVSRPLNMALMLKSGNLGQDTLFEDTLTAMERSE